MAKPPKGVLLFPRPSGRLYGFYKLAAKPPTTTLSGEAAVKLKTPKNPRPEGPSTLTALRAVSLAPGLQIPQVLRMIQHIEYIHIAGVDDDLRDAGIGEGQVPGPCQRDVDEGADDGSQRRSVADDGVGFVVSPLDNVIYGFHAALLAFFEGFAVGKFHGAGVVVHGFDHAGPDFFDFVVGFSFPVAEGEFFEVFVCFQGQVVACRNAFSGFGGPLEGTCDDAVQVDVLEPGCRFFGLGEAFFAQGHVGAALVAAGAVPQGLAVPYKVKCNHGW